MPLRVTSPQGRFAAEAEILDGERIELAETYGKHLFVHFTAPDPRHILYIHLGLIGKLRFEPREETGGQIRVRIDNGTEAANLRGPQFCRLLTEEEYRAQLAKVGQDPLRPDADVEALWAKVHKSRRSIGSLMMDQHLYAGVGNIYRAETLFRHGLSPFLPGRDVSRETFDATWADLVQLMEYGVEHGRIDTVRPEHSPEAMGANRVKTTMAGRYMSIAAPVCPAMCAAPQWRKESWRDATYSGVRPASRLLKGLSWRACDMPIALLPSVRRSIPF